MSSFSVTRAANGQIVLSLQNVSNYSVNGIGNVNGDINFSMGRTADNGSDETIMQIGQKDDAGCLKFEADATQANNFEFTGKNIDAEFGKKSETAYNVKWDVKNGSFDSSASKSSVIFEGGENSENNHINLGASRTKLGKYDNLIYDNGKSNIYTTDEETTTRVETMKDSVGAVVKAGNGQNDFYVGGSNSVLVGGSGKDSYITNKDTAYKNMMLGGDGNDVLTDYGSNSLFVGGKGTDGVDVHGKYGIANLGFDEAGNFAFGNGSYESSVFTGETQTDADGNVYSYKDILKLRGWDLETFLAESNLRNNPYYDLIQQEIEETLG